MSGRSQTRVGSAPKPSFTSIRTVLQQRKCASGGDCSFYIFLQVDKYGDTEVLERGFIHGEGEWQPWGGGVRLEV